jgi:hypothetical protein
MKFKLLLCGATLLVAGCASQQSPFASSGGYSYTYDLVPEPLPDLTLPELDKIDQVPATSATVLSSGASSQTSIDGLYSGH